MQILSEALLVAERDARGPQGERFERGSVLPGASVESLRSRDGGQEVFAGGQPANREGSVR